MRMCERKVWRGIYWTVDIYMTLNICVSIERGVEAYKPVYPGKGDDTSVLFDVLLVLPS